MMKKEDNRKAILNSAIKKRKDMRAKEASLYKKEIKKRGIKLSHVAKYDLKISKEHFCNILNGTYPMPEKIKLKLNKLLNI